MSAFPGDNPTVSMTPTDSIGHVAPDFDNRRAFNTLVVRPQYRISLRLGAIEDLFADPPTTDKGRMARLQVLGMFYVPLGHKYLTDPVKKADGTVIAPAASKTCWDWVTTKIFAGADPDAKIQELLTNWVIDGGQLPPPAAELADGSGPDPAQTTGANFKKLRLPGGYTFFKDWSGYTPPHYDPHYAQSGWLDDLYAMESLFYRDNPVLGKIPLIAKVEMMEPGSNEWKPAPNVWVYFQLVKPYALPAFDPAQPVGGQLNAPPLRATNIRNAAGAGPKKVVDTVIGLHPDGSGKDPQVTNAHTSVGGKRGQGNPASSTDVAPSTGPGGAAITAANEQFVRIFKLSETKGFNSQHGGARTPYTHKDYALPVKSDQATFPSAVKVMTNEEGEAGVIFMPSRSGGDCYRIRACVGPPTQPFKPEDALATRVESGTLVLWRSLRISQFIRQPVNVAPTIDTDWKDPAYNQPAAFLQANFGLWSLSQPGNQPQNFVGMANVEMSAMGDGTTTYDGMEPNFARAFCELAFDNDAAKSPRDLTNDEYTAAIAGAIAAAKVAAVSQGLGVNIDWGKLFYTDAADVNASTALAQVPMRPPKAYNALVPAARRIPVNGGAGPTAQNPTPAFANQMAGIITTQCQSGWIQALAQFGHLPGLTLFDGSDFALWMAPGFFSGMGGVAMEYRSFYAWLGANNWPVRTNMNRPPDGVNDYTAVFAHEFTHCHFRSHGIGKDPPGNEGGGAIATRHDKLADTICIMSYKSSEGQLCGKCVLAFRGYNILANPIASL